MIKTCVVDGYPPKSSVFFVFFGHLASILFVFPLLNPKKLSLWITVSVENKLQVSSTIVFCFFLREIDGFFCFFAWNPARLLGHWWHRLVEDFAHQQQESLVSESVIMTFYDTFSLTAWPTFMTPPNKKWVNLTDMQGKIHLEHIHTRWFKVTFSSPSWRSLNHLKGSLDHPKKVTKNCQVISLLSLTITVQKVVAKVILRWFWDPDSALSSVANHRTDSWQCLLPIVNVQSNWKRVTKGAERNNLWEHQLY